MKANKDLFRFTYKTQQMKHRLISIITVSVIFIFGTGCKQNNMDQSPKKEMQDSVSVFMLKKQNINKQFTFPSELSALDKAEVFAKVSGYIKTIKVEIVSKLIATELRFNNDWSISERYQCVIHYLPCATSNYDTTTAQLVMPLIFYKIVDSGFTLTEIDSCNGGGSIACR